MQKVMFFNFDYMGLGGLWQNISWLLTNQKKPLEINLHLNEKNIGKFIKYKFCFVLSIVVCFCFLSKNWRLKVI